MKLTDIVEQLQILQSTESPDAHRALSLLKDAVSLIHDQAQLLSAYRTKSDGVDVELDHYRKRITELETIAMKIQSERDGVVSFWENVLQRGLFNPNAYEVMTPAKQTENMISPPPRNGKWVTICKDCRATYKWGEEHSCPSGMKGSSV